MNAIDQYENYAHKNSPNGHRFVGIVGHTPLWAVDVKPGDGKVRNAFGLEVHVTDQYVHPSTPAAEAQSQLKTMREIWERGEADRASADDIRFMMDVAVKFAHHTAMETGGA